MSDDDNPLTTRLERAQYMRSLVDSGVSIGQIATDMGMTLTRVYQILAFADLAERVGYIAPYEALWPKLVTRIAEDGTWEMVRTP